LPASGRKQDLQSVTEPPPSRRWVITPILMACFVQSITTQQTWHDLHFGMSPAEAKAILKDKLRDDKPRLAEPGYVLDISSLVAEGVNGQGVLVFDTDTQKLKAITLVLSAGLIGKECGCPLT
jgi:hypothetical protein